MKRKIKLLFKVLPVLAVCYFIMTGQKSQHTADFESPKWNPDPRTSISLYPNGTFSILPQEDKSDNISNEPRIINSPSGEIVISPNFRVHPRSSPSTQSEVYLTRHPSNPLIMYGSANTFQGGNFCTGTYVTTNGGMNWYGNDTLFNPAGTPFFNYGDPGPVIDKNGRFLISYITLGGLIGASYSTNSGLNFSPTVTLPGSSSSSDKNLSGTDDAPSSPYYGRTYTVYTEFGSSYTNRIVMSWTSDGGVTWSNIAPVSPPPSSGHHHQGCDVRVGPLGQVYVAWANCRSNGQNSTEDSLGFAVSTDGGVSWISSRNNASNMNGIRAFSLFNGIRQAGFPRMDVDRSGGLRNGWIYVTTAEKFVSPATDTADIILHSSSDGGETWNVMRVNQDTPGNGKFQYQPAVRVDESGAVNIIYYDTRNTPTNDSAEIYISRSADGGNTWTDILISDHKFKPKPISGTASGYQGDYIGITSGRGLLWPFWSDDFSGSYQAWTASVRIYAYPLNSFNLVSPAAGTTIQVFPNNSSPIVFNWDTSSSSASYKWVFGSPVSSVRKLTVDCLTNSLTLSSGQLDNMLAGIGIVQGDSITGQWEVWSFRNNSANDSLVSANSPRNVTLKRGLPALTAFNLFSPLNNSSIFTLSSNVSPQYFKWRKSGAGVNFKLFYAKPDFSTPSNIKYSGSSNNSGFDTILTLRNSELDSIAARAGISFGDSAVGQWRVYAYNGPDSLASNLTYNVTLRRGTAPVVTTSVDSLVIDLPPNQTAQRSFVIGNTGQNPLNWLIVESLTDEINSGNAFNSNENSISETKNNSKNISVRINDKIANESPENSDSFSIDWAEENPMSGTIAALGNQTVIVTFNSAGLVPNNSYTGNLNIQSNDPLRPVKIFKLRLNVGPLGISSNTENGIPDNFELKQNFPNPFNPSTNIKYALPEDGFVSLKIYDITGKVVATLVNETKNAGYYELQFNASAFASGMYFYKISVNSFKGSEKFYETRKMLLIK